MIHTQILRWLLVFYLLCFYAGRNIYAQEEEGLASYYHARLHGRVSASGYRHDQDDFVAAHRTLPFGTYVRVTNLANSRNVIVMITDRGPRRRRRIIDVSEAAAKQLKFIKRGVTRVRIEVVPGPFDLRYLDFIEPEIPFLPVQPAGKDFRIIK